MSRGLRENSVWMYDDEERLDAEFQEGDLQNGVAQLMTGDIGYGSEINWENVRVRTFKEAGIPSETAGLVVTIPDGREFHISIMQRR